MALSPKDIETSKPSDDNLFEKKDGKLYCNFFQYCHLENTKYDECDYKCEFHTGDCDEKCRLNHEHCSVTDGFIVCGIVLDEKHNEGKHCDFISKNGIRCIEYKYAYHRHCPDCGDVLCDFRSNESSSCDNECHC